MSSAVGYRLAAGSLAKALPKCHLLHPSGFHDFTWQKRGLFPYRFSRLGVDMTLHGSQNPNVERELEAIGTFYPSHHSFEKINRKDSLLSTLISLWDHLMILTQNIRKKKSHLKNPHPKMDLLLHCSKTNHFRVWETYMLGSQFLEIRSSLSLLVGLFFTGGQKTRVELGTFNLANTTGSQSYQRARWQSWESSPHENQTDHCCRVPNNWRVEELTVEDSMKCFSLRRWKTVANPWVFLPCHRYPSKWSYQIKLLTTVITLGWWPISSIELYLGLMNHSILMTHPLRNDDLYFWQLFKWTVQMSS